MLQKYRQASVAQNILSLIISNGFGAVLSFGITALLGRALDVAWFGTYSAVLAWVFPFVLIAEFGLGTLITRELSIFPEQVTPVVSHVLRLRLRLSTSLIFMLILLEIAFPSQLEGIFIALPLVLILPVYSTYTAVFRAFGLMRWVMFLHIGMLALQLTTLGVLLWGDFTLTNALLLNTATSLGQLGIAMLWYYRHFPAQFLSTPASLPTETLFKRAFPLAIASLLGALSARLPMIVLGYFASSVLVGYFAIGIRFMDVIRLLPMAVFDAIFPRLSQLKATPDALNALQKKLAMGLFAFGILSTIALWGSATGLIETIFGESYLPSVPVLRVMALGILPFLAKNGLNLLFYALGQEVYANRVMAMTLGFLGVWFWQVPLTPENVAWGVICADCISVALLWTKRPR